VSQAEAIAETLWRRLAQAPHRLLAFDFDGTLAPYASDPREARARPESLERLARLAGRDRMTVAVVSGRTIASLERVVPIDRLHLVGEHGWEERPPGGATVHHPLSDQAASTLERILDALTRDGTKAMVERKRTGVAIHTRALGERDRAAAVEQFESICRRLAQGAELRLDVLDGGAEIHALGRDKGTAVRGLLAPLPAGTVPVYVGDDVTDEPAFAAAQERGFGIKVGPASTCARHALDGPHQVAELLAGILRALEEAA
jgi:trehalose 6-phosphate phosphatase